MSHVPTKQLRDLYGRIMEKPNYWVKSKNYEAYYDAKTGDVMLTHYDTPIFKVNNRTWEGQFGGWSFSDRDAINSFANLMGLDNLAWIHQGQLHVNDPWLGLSWALADDGDLGVCAEGTWDEEGCKAISITWFTRPEEWPCGACEDVARAFIYLDPTDPNDAIQTVHELNNGHDPVRENWPGINFENAFKLV